MILLAMHWKSPIGYRMAYLHLTLARSKCQGQCLSQFDCEKFDKCAVALRRMSASMLPFLVSWFAVTPKQLNLEPCILFSLYTNWSLEIGTVSGRIFLPSCTYNSPNQMIEWFAISEDWSRTIASCFDSEPGSFTNAGFDIVVSR